MIHLITPTILKLQTHVIDPKYKHLIGKRIEVITQDGTKLAGICTYIGINQLHNQFQVTLNRMPIWPVDPTKIKEIK